MLNTKILFIMAFAITLASLSCSNGANPVTLRDYEKSDEIPSNISTSSDSTRETGEYPAYPSVFGAWQIRIDLESLDYEILPARNAQAIGNIFDADLSQFLMVNPCSNCLRISSVQLNIQPLEEYLMFSTLEVNFQMKHPFNNITSRPDLHGFDVRLIILAMGDQYDYPEIMVMNPDGSEEPASFCENFLLNPDGFTSHYDDLVTDPRYFIGGIDIEGNLNPFLRFFENYSTDTFDPHTPAGHNVMPVGPAIDSRKAYFDLYSAAHNLVFFAIADVAYGQSAVLANRTNPQYYLPAFNRTEAWRVEYWIENNNLSDTDPASSADVVVQVFDWQQGATVDTSYPNPGNLSGIPESSNVLRVELNVSEYQDSLITATTPEAGSGTPTDPLRYRLTVTNENTSDNNAWGLLAVRDELHGHASPSGRLPVPESPAGFPYATQDIRDYTCYYIVKINYPRTSTENGYYVNGEMFVHPNSLYANDNELILASAFFMDMSFQRFLYEWDFDYNGSTFDVDGTDYPLQFTYMTVPGFRNVGLRVTTNTVPPRQYIYSIPVAVEGLWLNQNTNTGNIATTNTTRENAIAMTDSHYYFACTVDNGTKRDIYVGILDKKTGVNSFSNITQSHPGSFYNPAVEVIETGPHAGMYIAFTGWTAGDTNLYSIGGTLSGTIFTPVTFKAISADVALNENNVCLWHDDNNLFAYYSKEDPVVILGTQISVSTWDFSSADWTFRNVIHGPLEGDQNFPTVAVDGYYENLYCVWQDGQDYATRANDIYMSSSPDGILFSDPERVTNSPGLIDEMYPSLAITGRQIGIAYLYIDYAALDTRVHVAIIDSAMGVSSVLDHSLEYAPDRLHTIPSIGTGCEGRFTLAFGGYEDSVEELDAYIIEIVNEGGWTLRENLLFESNAGLPVPISGANIYPGVASRSIASGTAVENFILCRNFENGNVELPSPFPMRFGELQLTGIISDGKKWEPPY